MPTLQRRADGAYFIRNFYHDHHTWQVRGDGVRFLERRGVREGQFFDTALMMQLYMSGWIFTGGSGPRPGAPRRLTAAPINEALLMPIRALHGALVARRTEDALLTIAPTEERAADVRAGLASGLGVKGWKALDALVLPLNAAAQPGFDGVREAAVVTMRLTFATGTEVIEEIWVRGSEWRIVWGSLSRLSQRQEARVA